MAVALQFSNVHFSYDRSVPIIENASFELEEDASICVVGPNGGGNGQPQVARKSVNKVVHSDAPGEGAPDPRWAGELSKLKDLLANQKTAV